MDALDMQKKRLLSFTSGDNQISKLCDLYGSDKGTNSGNVRFVSGWHYHDYASIYELMFNSIRLKVQRVLEIGIGTTDPGIQSSMGKMGSPGASLRVWRDYFPSAEVVGVDIDDKVLFEEERITTFQCDQTDPKSIGAFFRKCHIKSFEIIIDDGLHTEEAANVFFDNAWRRLELGGFYFIEDASWWNGSKIDFLEAKGLKYFCFSDSSEMTKENTTNPLWNKLILIIKDEESI
jgi:hypothetical protein